MSRTINSIQYPDGKNARCIAVNHDTLRFITTRYDASDSDAYIRNLARFNAMYAINVGQRGQRADSYSASVLTVILQSRSRTQLKAAR